MGKASVHRGLAGAVGCILLFPGLSQPRAQQSTDEPPAKPHVVIQADLDSELAPHGQGNAYAPEILIEDGTCRMWYGALGTDGHDRIHYAESRDGSTWVKKGVVLEDREANHVNDPAVVRVGDRYLMYYTVAGRGVTDRIDVATSTDGLQWRRIGTALRPGEEGQWDSLSVGRPSVLVEGGRFRMWYDGRKDLPPGAPDTEAPKSPTSTRSVGYAVSSDGVHWTKHGGNPVFGHDAGAVHVVKWSDRYWMVYESGRGTMLAHSADGVAWKAGGMLAPVSGQPIDRHGHVTPFILTGDDGEPWRLFVGAAAAESWDRNTIVRFDVAPPLRDARPR